MAFAFEVYFDGEADARVRAIWHTIADAGIPQPLLSGTVRPHISLAACEQLDVTLADDALRQFAEHTLPISLSLEYVGVFNGEEGVLFAAPVVTQALLEVHTKFHEFMANHLTQPRAYYLPGRWVPHCTLAFGLNEDQMAQSLRIARQAQMPITLTTLQIGLAEVNPTGARDLKRFTLG